MQKSAFLAIVWAISLFLMLLVSSAQAQESPKRVSTKKRNKMNQKVQKEQKDEIEELTIFLREKHFENQDKATQKRMKKSQKRAQRNRANKKPFFLKTWWRKKIRR